MSELLDTVKATAILFYSPDDCFSCITPIAEWREVDASGRVQVSIVLTRPPTREETRSLNLQRIRVAGVYERPWAKRGAFSPREVLLDSAGAALSTVDDPRRGVTSALRSAIARVRAAGRPQFIPYIP
ncbi:MAG: hypothetical protein IT359_19755 [Gemmatimonadaceae bacterium]|nr:hypothetical protein [Gemmatimonadaceae bacterium]